MIDANEKKELNLRISKEKLTEANVLLQKEIAERKQAEEKLRKLSSAVVQSPSTVVITNTKGEIEYVNPKFTQTSGYTLEEVLGQNPRLLKSGDMPPEGYQELWDTITAGKEWRGEFHNRRKNGELYWEFASISPIRDENGNITHFLAVKEDITERKRVEEELQRALEAAEAANKAKSEFLATMSHEIRTPMNGIIGMTELLIETELNPKQQEYAGIIRDSAELLLSIINDILDFSKIEAGKLELESINFKIPTIIENVSNLMLTKAREKEIQLKISIDSDLSGLIRGDSLRLHQILLNLVSNAIKFTHQGQVKVNALLQDDRTDSLLVHFEVKDTGIGIPEAAQKRIFRPFSQADSSTTRKYSGTGLGLTITKRLVELMGGRIGLESEIGKGTTFWFTIPFKKYEQQCREIVEANEVIGNEFSKKDFTGQQILLVEDNPVNRQLVLAMIEKYGLKVDIATNGQEAVTAFSTKKYSMILMDCQMPVMDGFAATRAIRQIENSKNANYRTPIIALTALAMTTDRDKCLNAGMDDYLSKPFKMAEIERVLKRWLAANKDNAQTNQEPTPQQNSTAIDVDVLREYQALLAKGQPDYVSKLIKIYISDAEPRVVSLQEAVAVRDLSRIGFLAHSLKSSSAGVGAKILAGICEELELQARRGIFEGAETKVTGICREFKKAKQAFEDILAKGLESFVSL